MFVSKYAKKAMTLVVALAMICSILPSAITKAAENSNPTVTVKGATLRITGNDTGKQSLRLGIEIGNADLATACGMKIEYKGKSVTIATDKGQKEIYEVDAETKKVIYTAIIENIPSTSFAEDFKVTGLVKSDNAADYSQSAAVTKSVNGVVEALGAGYKLVEGKLVKEIGTLNFDKIKTGQYDWEQVAIDADGSGHATYEVLDNYNSEKCLKISQSAGADSKMLSGLKFKFSEMNSSGRTFYVEAKACAANGFYITSYSPKKATEEKDVFTTLGTWITGSSAYGYESFSLKPNTDSDDLYVASYDVYEAVTTTNDFNIAKNFSLDLSKINIEFNNNTMSKINNEDGSVTLKWNADAAGYDGFKFHLAEGAEGIDLSEYKTCKIDAEGDTMNIELMDATRKEPQWGNALAIISEYGKSFPYSVDLTKTPTNTDTLGLVADYKNVGCVRFFKSTGSDEHTLTIKSITFIAK